MYGFLLTCVPAFMPVTLTCSPFTKLKHANYRTILFPVTQEETDTIIRSLLQFRYSQNHGTHENSQAEDK